jgi:YD repeat-containing protein
VSYTYDSLNRLIAAATTNPTGVQWSESYTYDGFGNLTSKVSSMGTSSSPQVDSTTNRARVIGDYGLMFAQSNDPLSVEAIIVNHHATPGKHA